MALKDVTQELYALTRKTDSAVAKRCRCRYLGGGALSRQFYHPPSPYNLEQRCHHKKIKLVILHDPLADWADKRTNLDDLVSKHGWSTTESSKFVTDHKTKLLRMRRATLTKLRSKIRTVAPGLLDKHVPGRDLSKHTELAQVLTSAIGLC